MQIIDVTPAAGLFASGAAGALRAADQRAAERKQQELQAAQAARFAADSARMERQMSLAERDFALQEQTVNQARADQTAITDSLMGQLRPQLGSRVAGLAPGQAGPPEAGAQLSPLEQSFRELERKYKGGEVSAGAAGEIASQLGKAAMQAEIEAKREEMVGRITARFQGGMDSLAGAGLSGVDADGDGKTDDLTKSYMGLMQQLEAGADPDAVEMQFEVLEGQIAAEITKQERRLVYEGAMRTKLATTLQTDASALTPEAHTLSNAVIARMAKGDYKFGEEKKAMLDFENALVGQIPFPDDSPFAGAYGPPEVVMQYTGGAGGGRGRAMASPEDQRMELFAKGVDTLNKIIREPRREDYVNELGEVDSAGYAAAVEQYKSDRIAAAQRLGIGELFPAPKAESAQGGAQGETPPSAPEVEPAKGLFAWKNIRGGAARNAILEEIADTIVSGKNPDPSKSVVAVQKVDLNTLDEKARAEIAEKVNEKRVKRLDVIERELDAQRKRDYEKNKGDMGVMGEEGAWDKPGEKPAKAYDVRDPFGREPMIPRREKKP